MLVLATTSDVFQLITSAAGQIDTYATYADVSGTTVTVGRQVQRIGTATTTAILSAPAASTSRNAKRIAVSNNHASITNTVTFQFFDGTNTIVFETFTLAPGERFSYSETAGIRVFDSAGLEKSNSPLAQGQYSTQRLAADVSNATTTAAKLTGLDLTCGVGTWIFEYLVLYQAAAATTGVKFSVNHTGTVTSFVYDIYGVSADTTATATQTALMDQDVVTTTGGLMEAWAARAKSTAAGVAVSSGVDTLAADMLMLITGLAIVTASGNLELYHASEVAAATTVRAGSGLRLTKIG
jgi:hypothetical protein